MPAAMTEKPLNSLERTTLRNAEKVIDEGKSTFLTVGNALKTVQDGKLYRETHKTFQLYVEDRHDFKRAWAYRLIQKAEVAENLSTAVDKSKAAKMPSRQVMALAKLPPEQQEAAYQDAAEGEEIPSTEAVEQSVDTYLADNVPYVEQDEDLGEEEDEEEEANGEELMEESKRGLNTLARAITGLGKDAATVDDPWLNDRLDILKAHLRTAAGVVRACMGEGACTYCDGEGCERCLESGWLPKVELTAAPEVKA